MGRADRHPLRGRPSRGGAELAAVRKALSAMPGRLSARAKCRTLAARVVAHLIRLGEADEFELAINRTLAVVDSDPALQLAIDPDADLASELQRERLERFAARGCVQLSPDGWQAETRQIAQALEGRLAERFRRAMKNRAKNDF